MMSLWQSFVELIHELIPWLDGGIAIVIIILIKGIALVYLDNHDGLHDLCRT